MIPRPPAVCHRAPPATVHKSEPKIATGVITSPAAMVTRRMKPMAAAPSFSRLSDSTTILKRAGEPAIAQVSSGLTCEPYRLGSTSCNARIRVAGLSRMLRCCSICTNLPDELAASIVHASGEPFETRPCTLSVPHRLSAVRPSGGQLQLPAVIDCARRALRSRWTSAVSEPVIRVPSDKVTSTGSDEFPCRFNEIG